MGVMGGCWFPALLWTGQPGAVFRHLLTCKYRAQELCRKRSLGTNLKQRAMLSCQERSAWVGAGQGSDKAFQCYEEKETQPASPASASPAHST